MNLFEISVDQHMDMIEYAGNMLDKHDSVDCTAPSLVEVISTISHFDFSIDFSIELAIAKWNSTKQIKSNSNEFFIFIWCGGTQVTGISQHHMATASGLSDYDYQSLTKLTMGLKNLNQIETVTKVPIPTEIMEHFKSKFSCCAHSQSFFIHFQASQFFRIKYNVFKWIQLDNRMVQFFNFFRYKMSLYDGLVPRNRPSMVDHRFGYLCKCIINSFALLACRLLAKTIYF